MESKNDIDAYFKVGSIFRSSESPDQNKHGVSGQLERRTPGSKMTDFRPNVQLQKPIAKEDVFADDVPEGKSPTGEDICRHRRRQKLQRLIAQESNRSKSEGTICSRRTHVSSTENCHKTKVAEDYNLCDSGSNTNATFSLGPIHKHTSMDGICHPYGHADTGIVKEKKTVDNNKYTHTKMALGFSTDSRDTHLHTEHKKGFDRLIGTDRDQSHIENASLQYSPKQLLKPFSKPVQITSRNENVSVNNFERTPVSPFPSKQFSTATAIKSFPKTQYTRSTECLSKRMEASKLSPSVSQKVQKPFYQTPTCTRNAEYLSKGSEASRIFPSISQKLQKPTLTFKTEFMCHFDKKYSSDCRVTGLAPTKDGKFWVAGEGQRCIRLFDVTGRLADKRYIGTEIDDLALDHHGNLYMSCPSMNQIKWIQSGKTGIFENATFVRTPCKPRGIAFDSTDNSLVVCLQDDNSEFSNVVKYSISKNKLCSCIFLFPKEFLKQPVRVATSPIGGVFVSDIGTCQVVNLKSDNRHPVAHTGSSDFGHCYGITCDAIGKLVVLSRKRKHAIISDGKSTIAVQMDDLDIDDDILSIALDDFGILWVGCGENTVKVFEYQGCE